MLTSTATGWRISAGSPTTIPLCDLHRTAGGGDGTFTDSFQPLDGFAVGKEPWGFAHTFGDVGNSYCRIVDGVGLMCTNLPVCHK